MSAVAEVLRNDRLAGGAVTANGGGALSLLSRRAREGDTRAFQELVARSHATLYRLALAFRTDPDEAADVVQETYVRAWSRRAELRDPGAALGWLCRIARNVAHDRRRSFWERIRAPLGLAAEVPAAGGGAGAPDEALAAAEEAATVRRALARLPEKHRVVLVLREVEGMSYEEIAEALGLPVGTVESRLHRARRGLARRLGALARREDVP